MKLQLIVCVTNLFYLIQPSIANKQSTKSSHHPDEYFHKALVGSRTRLNCKISVSTNDSVQLILWWRRRDATGPPFYKIDARNRSLSSASHIIDNTNYTGRVEFDLNRSQLIINHVREEDDGDYTCRVDYKAQRTRYTYNHLYVQVPPKKLMIEETHSGKLLNRHVGPFNENSTLPLSCKAFKGQPKPYLEWYIDDVPIKSSDSQYDPMKEETYTRLELNLERKYDKSQIKCVANLKDFLSVLVTEITIHLNLTPLNTTIQFIKSNVVAGNIEMISCHSYGSKPPANITWFIGDYELNNSRLTIDETNLFSTSLLKFTPSVNHNGKHLICKAINPHFPDYSKTDQILLNVHHKPNVHLIISGPDNEKNYFMEGDSVRMNCNTSFSNPDVTSYQWYHETSRIYSEPLKGINVDGEILLLHSVGREHIGRYVCIVSNNIGESKSNFVSLNILYAPQCSSQQKIIYAFRPNVPIQIKCQIDANPPEVTFSWTESQSNSLPSDIDFNISSSGLSSILTFTPITTNETIFACSAVNSVGKSKDSCFITLKPAGPPEAPRNCNISPPPSTTDLLTCIPGSDGGVDQNFVVQIHPSDNLDLLIGEKIANANPVFHLKGLQSNRSYHIEIYAENELGRSQSLIIPFTTHVTESTSIIPSSSSKVNLMSMVIYPATIIVAIFITIALFMIKIHLKSKSYKPSEDGSSERVINGKANGLANFVEKNVQKEASLRSLVEHGNTNKLTNGSTLVVGVDSQGNVVTREIGDTVVVTVGSEVNSHDEGSTLIGSSTYLISDKNARNMEVSTQVSYSPSATKLSSMVQDVSNSLQTVLP
ncbi:carcinoembryonic antigen-related cell adhesion molecule 5-like isoform X1 [Tetranychus urticae]|uniref:carcinoembryonic antigen-related cell adhesion molecule 5-like isoform X1 n=1 Tax=Tetranychus urticae TaxID=32264 RepID=UPI000D657AB7|nr:carcinoembryonic antigen-related cell adhesion molecule 5-like isoform X1 [Tetranychus urticae]